eukprot:427167-Karenia_brevis.AAC.1
MWDAELVLKVKGVPGDRQVSRATCAVFLPTHAVPSESPSDVGATVPPRRRQVYILKKDLDEIDGYTSGCPACKVIAEGLPRHGVNHSLECRARIEGEMAARSDQRLLDADWRMSEAVPLPGSEASQPAC